MSHSLTGLLTQALSSRPSRRGLGASVLILGLLCGGRSVAVDGRVIIPLETTTFTQLSDPPGFVDLVQAVATDTNVTTTTAPESSSGYRFTHWTVDDALVPPSALRDNLGRALNPITFTIYQETVATAHYLEESRDDDLDGVPDWYEIQYFNGLQAAADDDTDGDGMSTREEYERDTHPAIYDSVGDGGVTRRATPTTFFLNAGLGTLIVSSDPVGFQSAITGCTNGTVVNTPYVQGAANGYTFAYWSINGVRQADSLGIAVAQVTVTVSGLVHAVAHYLPSDEDSDGDGVPDWYEQYYIGNLSQDAAADPDGDGLSMASEYERDTCAVAHDAVVDGGITRRASPTIGVNIQGFVHVVIRSEPSGFVDENLYLPSGTPTETPYLNGARNGYVFSRWTRDGVDVRDALGMALAGFTFSPTSDSDVVAHYLPADEDSDRDGIADWYEWHQLGTLIHNGEYDGDGDGIGLADEYARSTTPVVADTVSDGGVSRRQTAKTFIDMQMFERPSYVLRDGLLSPFFSPDPPAVTGHAFGDAPSPALGDWDGDGDYDLFVATTEKLYAWENIGSPYSPDFRAVGPITYGGAPTERTVAMGDWTGDGKADLAVLTKAEGRLQFTESNGSWSNGGFGSVSSELILTGSLWNAFCFADLDSTGQPELVVVTSEGIAGHVPGGAYGAADYHENAYVPGLVESGIPNAVGMAFGDVDHDFVDDLLVSDVEGRIWKFLGQPLGGFALNSRMWAGSGPGFAGNLTLTVADLDGDNDRDALCGFSQGGITWLRDPKLGPPAGLRARSGGDRILVEWEPVRASRVTGYQTYRSDAPDGNYAYATGGRVRAPRYHDLAPLAGITNWYTVSSLTMANLPGNSTPREMEGPKSGPAGARANAVTAWMGSANTEAGSFVRLPLNIDFASGIAGDGSHVDITYNASLLTPASQISVSNRTVELAPAAGTVSFSDDSDTATGAFSITGNGGELTGSGRVLDVTFWASTNVPATTTTLVTITSAYLQTTNGTPVSVTLGIPASVVISASGGLPYSPGDLDGNGVLNMDDFNHFQWLLQQNTRGPTADEVQAGDLNGDGVLDHRDGPLILRMIHDKPLTKGASS